VRRDNRKRFEHFDPSIAYMTHVGKRILRVHIFDTKEVDDLTGEMLDREIVFFAIDQLRVGLTALTEEELRAFYEGMRLAIFYALPIVRKLDKEAQDEYKQGLPPRRRFYQRPPVVSLKRQLFGRNAEGIQERFSRVVELDRLAPDQRPDPTGLAASGTSRRAIPEQHPEDDGSFDGEPEVDDVPDLGEGPR